MRRGLTCCSVVAFLVLVAGTLVLLVGVPALGSLLTAMDTQPVFELAVGEREALVGLDLVLADIRDSRCPADVVCVDAGVVEVVFEVLPPGAALGSGTTFTLTLPDEGPSDALTLPGGALVRVLGARSALTLPGLPDQPLEVVRFQVFLLPDA